MLALLLLARSLLSAQQAPDPGTSAQLDAINKVTHAKHELIERATEKLDLTNRATFEELYDAVMGIDHVVHIPNDIRTALKGAMVSAELAYWRRTKPGVDENEAVKAFNRVVTTLALPDEAKMTLGQFQVIRHGLLVNFNPQFMGKNIDRRTGVKGEVETNSRVSPLQTMHIVMSVMDTKLLDMSGRWMITPEEWEKLDESQFFKPRPAGAKLVTRAGDLRTDNAKRVGLKLDQVMYRMTDSDGLTMLKYILSNLGAM